MRGGLGREAERWREGERKEGKREEEEGGGGGRGERESGGQRVCVFCTDFISTTSLGGCCQDCLVVGRAT